MEASDEEFISEEEGENPSLALKKLRERLATAVKEKQEYLEGWQRARADFANYKRDESARLEHTEHRIKQEFAESVIVALDSFEMAFKSPSFEKASQEWRAGMAGLYSELLKSLQKFGIVSYSPVGAHFNPQEHEAIRETPVDDQSKEHMIISVERSGYKLGEHIVRPAQVSIGVFKQ